MLEWLVTAGYIVICIALFSLAIAIHEFGHFIVALKLGLKVDRFSIGFGPALWKRTFRGVEYRISAIPLGGYVSIPDVDPEGTKAVQGEGGGARAEIPPWKEIAVAFAGPAMNIVLAVVLAFVLAAVPSANFGVLGTEIGSVIPGGPAERAGMKAGDKVLSVNGNEVKTWTEFQVEVQIGAERESIFEVVRCSGETCSTLELRMTPERDKVTGTYKIMAYPVNDPAVSACSWMQERAPLRQLSNDASAIFRALKGLVTPKEMRATGRALGGPVLIAEGIYNSVRRDFWDGIGFLRFLNVNLAVLNLLPIPVLDGGLILFSLFALVFRRRLPQKFVDVVTKAFMVLLLLLMGFLVLRDSMRSYRIHTFKPPVEAEKGAK